MDPLDPDAVRTVQEAVRAASAHLRRAGVPSPEVDARALVERALGLEGTGLGGAGLLTRGPQALGDEERRRLGELLARRAAREPLQYLLGEVEWGGVRLRVDARALVPRPETEWLLHLALGRLRGVTAPRVLDVGTGTGALALGVKAARPDASVTATDLSPAALDLARENAALNGLSLDFYVLDLLGELRGPYDLLLSNPPYLPEADRPHAEPEVRHDPPLALYAGADGLDLARRLALQARTRLARGGRMWLELDPRNAGTFAAELRAAGWQAALHADLVGRERFVEAWEPDPEGQTP